MTHRSSMKFVLPFIVLLGRFCQVVHSQARIVGGSAVAAGKYPFYAFVLVDVTNGSIPCGASLVHSDMLLTSASCVAPQGGGEEGGGGTTIIEVALNFTNFDNSRGKITRKVSNVMVHPDFNMDTLANDIAMLLLDNTVTDVETASYNTNASIPAEATSMTVIGFGSLSAEEFEPSRTLQEVTLQVVNFKSCNIVYNGILNQVGQICSGVPGGGMDSCIGDAGGPLLDDNDLIVGIVSGGNGCGKPGYPGFNTRVSGYIDFISQTICDMSSDKPSSCSAAPVMIPTLPPITSVPVSTHTIAHQPISTITMSPESYSPIANPEPIGSPITLPPVEPPNPFPVLALETSSPIAMPESEPVAPPSSSPVVATTTATYAPIAMPQSPPTVKDIMTLPPSEGKKGRYGGSEKIGAKTKGSKKSSRGDGKGSTTETTMSSDSNSSDDDNYVGKKGGSLRIHNSGEYRRKVRGL